MAGNYLQELDKLKSRQELEAENARLKAAFDDRVRIIEMQLEDKRKLREALEEIADIVALYKDGRETAVYEIAKAALGESDE